MQNTQNKSRGKNIVMQNLYSGRFCGYCHKLDRDMIGRCTCKKYGLLQRHEGKPVKTNRCIYQNEKEEFKNV